jgi:hypothetical protein
LTSSMHLLAPQSLPIFFSSPGGPDYLMVGMVIFLIAFVFAIGIIYLGLHALPDHIAHKGQKIQFEIVCVFGLLAMFTHIHAFWVAGLLLAMVDLPDFSTPLRRISGALDRIAINRQHQLAARRVHRRGGSEDEMDDGRESHEGDTGFAGHAPAIGADRQGDRQLPPRGSK